MAPPSSLARSSTGDLLVRSVPPLLVTKVKCTAFAEPGAEQDHLSVKQVMLLSHPLLQAQAWCAKLHVSIQHSVSISLSTSISSGGWCPAHSHAVRPLRA